jgi:hypothetical protein
MYSIGDVIDYIEPDDSDFDNILEKQINYITNSHCYSSFIEQHTHTSTAPSSGNNRTSTLQLPTLYVSSGIFQYKSKNSFLYKRYTKVMQALSSLGFTTIVHNQLLNTNTPRYANKESLNSNKQKPTKKRKRSRLHPEQYALIDLEVSSHSKCVIPCYMTEGRASSFSYMVTRFRQLNKYTLNNVKNHQHLEVGNRGDVLREYPEGGVFLHWGL